MEVAEATRRRRAPPAWTNHHGLVAGMVTVEVKICPKPVQSKKKLKQKKNPAFLTSVNIRKGAKTWQKGLQKIQPSDIIAFIFSVVVFS